MLAFEELPPLPDIIAPLAPKSTGWSSEKSPNLHWYLSDPWAGELNFTLNRVGAPEPELELTLPTADGVHGAGMHSLSLKDHGVELEPGVEYEWFVFIVPDEVERSADLISSATIRYMPADDSMADSSSEKDFSELFAMGYWYDGIDLLSARIEEGLPLHSARAALMRQVDMPKVALYDEQAAEI
jgi:hypothetical protein